MDSMDKSIPEASTVLCNGKESNSKADVIIIDDAADNETHEVSDKHVANTTNQDSEHQSKTAVDPTAIGNENEQGQSANSFEKKHEQEDTNPVQTNKTIIEKDLYTSPELEKYWKAVKDNPADFTGWTYLLQFVEQEVLHFFLEDDLLLDIVIMYVLSGMTKKIGKLIKNKTPCKDALMCFSTIWMQLVKRMMHSLPAIRTVMAIGRNMRTWRKNTIILMKLKK